MDDKNKGVELRPVLIWLLLVLAGCAGVHPYSEARVGFAASAKAAYDKVDFDTFIHTRKSNIAALHARDLQLAELRAKADRGTAILAILTSQTDWTQLDAGMNKQDRNFGVDTTPIKTIPCPTGAWPRAGGTAKDPKPRLIAYCLLAGENDRRQHNDDLRVSADFFRLEWRIEPPACNSTISAPILWTDGPAQANLPKRYAAVVKDLTGDVLGVKQFTYSDYLEKCLAVRTDETNESTGIGNGSWQADSLPDLYARIARAKGAYDQQVADTQNAVDTLQAATEALKDAVKRQPGNGTVSADATKAIGEVQQALNTLEDVGKATGIGQSAAAQTRLAAINAFIAALSESGTDTAAAQPASQPSTALTPDLAHAAAVLKTLPALADQVQTVNNTLHAPRLSALELEKARQGALAAQATRTQARAQQRVAILQAAYDDRVDALRQLINARLERQKGLQVARAVDKAAAQASETANMKALNYYQIAVYFGSRSQALLRANQVDLEEQAAVDSAQFAIDSYRAALTVPLGQFVAYENAGIKASDLAQALAGIATAVGVNILAGK